MRRSARLLIVLTLVLAPASAAWAKSFWIESADIDIVVNSDGSLGVTETLTFNFNGSFSGAYRDIRLRPGETLTNITVNDERIAYDLGGCTQLGCSSPPGTFGVEVIPGYARVVWHHSSFDELRAFQIKYTMSGMTRAYDDVVDVNFQVWGDQWAVGANHVTARVHLPGLQEQGSVLVWGHPFNVDGETSLGDDGVSPSLTASNVPSEQWVELRTVFPTAVLESTGGATVVAGDGLELILAEEREFAADAEAAEAAARSGLLWAAGIALFIIVGLGGLVYFVYGREPRVDYDREYEQEPPSDLSPAEVGALLSQGAVDEKEFTATLFDLIRQGALEATPSQVTRSTWGGLKNESITDLVLSLGEKQTGLRDFEQSVMNVMRRVLELGPRPLHEFRSGIREDASANATTYQSFRDKVLGAIRRSGMLDDSGHGMSWLIRGAVIAVTFASFFILPGLLGGSPAGSVLVGFILFGLIAGSVILFIFLSFRRIRNRRSKAGALEAARWAAFRRYLTDFSRLEEAPVIALDLWDRYLVYAITFGVAEEVLEKARLHAPPELHETSSIYWFGNYGYTGGHTENAFSGIQSALSGAFTPPSSSGGGGGFSSGGGSGGGGGGGGAW